MAQRTTRRASSKPAKTRSYHHGDLRRALLDAALEILSTEGSEALTLREAARRAGVTHAAPYRHFADKEALLAAVAEEGFRALTVAMRERMAAHATDSWGQLRQAGIAYVLFAVEHPAHYRVMFGPYLVRGEGTSPYPSLAEAGKIAFGILSSAVEEAQAQGVVEPGDTMQISLAAWAMMHGLAMLFVDHQLSMMNLGPEHAETVAMQVTTVLERGIARR